MVSLAERWNSLKEWQQIGLVMLIVIVLALVVIFFVLVPIINQVYQGQYDRLVGAKNLTNATQCIISACQMSGVALGGLQSNDYCYVCKFANDTCRVDCFYDALNNYNCGKTQCGIKTAGE